MSERAGGPGPAPLPEGGSWSGEARQAQSPPPEELPGRGPGRGGITGTSPGAALPLRAGERSGRLGAGGAAAPGWTGGRGRGFAPRLRRWRRRSPAARAGPAVPAGAGPGAARPTRPCSESPGGCVAPAFVCLCGGFDACVCFCFVDRSYMRLTEKEDETLPIDVSLTFCKVRKV